jgi:hypothetical protein
VARAAASIVGVNFCGKINETVFYSFLSCILEKKSFAKLSLAGKGRSRAQLEKEKKQ